MQVARAELEELAGPLEIIKEELAEAIAREAEADRQRKQARVAEIRQQVSHTAVMQAAAPMVEREVDLLRQVVEVRIERQQLRRELERRVSEAESLLRELGEPDRLDHRASYADLPGLTADALEQTLQTMERDDPRWRMLFDVIHNLAPGRTIAARASSQEACA